MTADPTLVYSSPFARPADPDKTHSLLVVVGTAKGRRLEVGSAALTIGRSVDGPGRLDDATLSGRHCSAMVVGAEMIIHDHETTNGSFIDGQRVTDISPLPVGGDLFIGEHVLRHEVQTKQEMESAKQLASELDQARSYVESLLPVPIRQGPVTVDWRFVPSAILGGDAFHYETQPDDSFVFCLIDVCGHGAGAAMHSVSVINLLRSHGLPGTVDPRDPSAVLDALNEMFQMDSHHGMYFTAWYGTYDPESRTLTYSSAGHPPALLLDLDGHLTHLRTKGLGVGMLPAYHYRNSTIDIPAGSRLFVFSDGVYEVELADGTPGRLKHLERLIRSPSIEDRSDVDRIYDEIVSMSATTELEDDFSLLGLTFE